MSLEDMFSASLDKKKPKPRKAKPKKEKEVIVIPPTVDFNQQMNDAFNNPPVDEVMDDLTEESHRAKLEQEISKAETMKYKAEQERLKLKRAAGEVMEFDRGDLLFFGFIEKASMESLRVTKKLEARIKNLCDENDYKGIMNIVDRELENVFVNIQEEQMGLVKKWQRELK